MSLSSSSKLITLLATLFIASCATKPTVSTTNTEDPGFEKLSIQMMANNHDQALVTLKQLQKRYPGNASLYVNYALIYKKKNEPEKTREMLSKALSISPKNPAANNLLGIMHRESGDFQEALSAYKRAIDHNPDYAMAHANIGILYDIYLNDFQHAEEHYKRYLAITGQPDKQISGWLADLKRRK